MAHKLCSGGPQWGVLSGGQKVYVEKVFMCFFSVSYIPGQAPVWTMDMGDGHELGRIFLNDIFGLRTIWGMSLWPVFLRFLASAQCTPMMKVSFNIPPHQVSSSKLHVAPLHNCS